METLFNSLALQHMTANMQTIDHKKGFYQIAFPLTLLLSTSVSVDAMQVIVKNL